MSRIPLDVIEIEFGEDANYTPPADADRWAAALRTDIMAPMDYTANPGITHGGPPPEWQVIGRFDIDSDIYIPSPKSPATGLDVTASAARFTVPWESLREFAGSIQREALMVVAYADGKAIQRTIFRIPAPSAIDPGVIAEQERLLLQSLLRTRDQRAGSGGVIKLDHGEAGAEEFESLAVLDRRIAECRARIAWFEDAAEGNNLPRAVYW